MKTITNTGVQGKQILLMTAKGASWQYLAPRERVVVSDSMISEQIKTLVKRREIKLENS